MALFSNAAAGSGIISPIWPDLTLSYTYDGLGLVFSCPSHNFLYVFNGIPDDDGTGPPGQQGRRVQYANGLFTPWIPKFGGAYILGLTGPRTWKLMSYPRGLGFDFLQSNHATDRSEYGFPASYTSGTSNLSLDQNYDTNNTGDGRRAVSWPPLRALIYSKDGNLQQSAWQATIGWNLSQLARPLCHIGAALNAQGQGINVPFTPFGNVSELGGPSGFPLNWITGSSGLIPQAWDCENSKRLAFDLTKDHAISISNGSPAVITYLSHGFGADQPFSLTTTGVLPDPLVSTSIYYVLGSAKTNDTFRFALAPSGTPINTTSNGSGTQMLSVPRNWNAGDPAHNQLVPQFALACMDHPLGVVLLWLLYSWYVQGMPPFVFNTYQGTTSMYGYPWGQERSFHWSGVLMYLYSYLAGIQWADPNLIRDWCGGLKPSHNNSGAGWRPRDALRWWMDAYSGPDYGGPTCNEPRRDSTACANDKSFGDRFPRILDGSHFVYNGKDYDAQIASSRGFHRYMTLWSIPEAMRAHDYIIGLDPTEFLFDPARIASLKTWSRQRSQIAIDHGLIDF